MKLNAIVKISIASGVILFATMGTNFAPVWANGSQGAPSLVERNPTVPEESQAVVASVPAPVPVPEPLTISGSLAALGIGWQMRRKMKKKA
ncbi:MAG: PEP-CTERM sorting domain-containing protein [Rhizonema sp. PD37]|nr:PEP-CTERM sorting domain-containing protein [Rhizonema sp. PD37]